MIFRRWRWLLLDVVLVALGCAAGVGLVREVVGGRSLPPVRVAAEADGKPGPADAAAPPSPRPPRARGGAAAYAVIAARNLFNASRGEAAVVPIAPVGVAATPLILHGVVIDGEQSRAYLDDPIAKRVFGYAVGDTVAGGRLEKIQDDRIAIRRPEGLVEVLLQDPAKPPADAPAPPPASGSLKARRAGGKAAAEPPKPTGEEPPRALADPPAPAKAAP